MAGYVPAALQYCLRRGEMLRLIFMDWRKFMKRNKKGQFEKGSGIHDLSRRRFGQLEVIGLSEIHNKRSYWLCNCDCGNTKIVRSDALISYKTVSCGCLKKKQDIINLHMTNQHGMTYHPVYSTWSSMMNRCYSKHNTFYNDYGGRGITVCDEWHDVRNFCKWAEKTGYRKPLTIERMDVNGNYEPDNCIWITQAEQGLNKRNTIRIVYQGEKLPLLYVSRRLGLKDTTVCSRWKNGIRDNERLLYKGSLYDYNREMKVKAN